MIGNFLCLSTIRPINRFDGVDLFLRRWSSRESALSISQPLRSEFGNLNLLGESACKYATPFTPKDPGFDTSLEPVVAEAVITAVSLGIVTYTSCEGHEYSNGQRDLWHVGTIDRNGDLKQFLLKVTEAYRMVRDVSMPELVVYEGSLHCTQANQNYPCYDLYFLDLAVNFDDYKLACKIACNILANIMRKNWSQ